MIELPSPMTDGMRETLWHEAVHMRQFQRFGCLRPFPEYWHRRVALAIQELRRKHREL